MRGWVDGCRKSSPWGLKPRVQGLGLRVMGFRVWGLGFRVQG